MTPISPETRQFINEHQSDDVRNLALQARKYPDVDIPAAITQIAGRQIAAEKITEKRMSAEKSKFQSRILKERNRL